MATTKNDKSSVAEEIVLKRQKKLARREAKLMREIQATKKNIKKAQKKQSKALARLEEQNTTLHRLEARLEELRIQSPRAATGKEPIPLLSEEIRLPEGSVVMIDAAKMDALS